MIMGNANLSSSVFLCLDARGQNRVVFVTASDEAFAMVMWSQPKCQHVIRVIIDPHSSPHPVDG